MINVYVLSITNIVCLTGLVLAQHSISSDQNLDPSEQGNAIGKNITAILNSFFENKEKKYDKRVRPNYGGLPVTINVTMQIIGISSVSEVQMDFTCDMYFRQFWNDPRLSFQNTSEIHALFVGAEVADRIWVPDTFFANEKSASFHYATVKNTFLRIGYSGDVKRSIRLTVTASCPMELQYFPMDSQKCTLQIESYGYDIADMIYKWTDGQAVELSKDLTLPQFRVLGHRQYDRVEVLSTGNYSRLICEVMFARSLGFYLIQIYIPASLIVVISWVSFWLHRNATPARVSLGVTTVLTMTTLMSSVNNQLPKISYIKSIDVFLGTCFVMVFASLVEYATVGYLGKRIAMRRSRIEQLMKLAEEHRKKCAAANAAAELAAQEHNPIPHSNPSPMRCPPGLPMDSIACGMKAPVCVHPPGSRYIAGPPPKMVYGGGPNQSYRVIKPKSKLSSSKTSLTGDGLKAPPPTPFGPKDLNRMHGVSPSDIDKYSRVVFPACFVCFNLMYWIIYMHISAKDAEKPTT